MLCSLLLSQIRDSKFKFKPPNVLLFALLGGIWGFSKAGWIVGGHGSIIGIIEGLYIHKSAKFITQIFGKRNCFTKKDYVELQLIKESSLRDCWEHS